VAWSRLRGHVFLTHTMPIPQEGYGHATHQNTSDGVLTVVVILVGTASGSAIAMFVMSAIGLALMVVLAPRKQLRSGLLIALLAAVIGIGVVFAFLKLVPVGLLR